MGFDGDDLILIVGLWLVVWNSHHEGDRGAIEVAIQKTNLEALRGEGDGEV